MNQEEFKDTHFVHSYIRSHKTDDGTKTVWKCNNPLCNHTVLVPNRNRTILIGKMSLCPQCEINNFVLTSRHLDRKKPICELCKNPEKTQIAEKGKEIVTDLMKGFFNQNDNQ